MEATSSHPKTRIQPSSLANPGTLAEVPASGPRAEAPGEEGGGGNLAVTVAWVAGPQKKNPQTQGSPTHPRVSVNLVFLIINFLLPRGATARVISHI